MRNRFFCMLFSFPAALPIVIAAAFLLVSPAAAEAGEERVLSFSKPAPTGAQVTAIPEEAGGNRLKITITPGPESYPGCVLKPEKGEGWDLSAYGHLDAMVQNTGKEAAQIFLRVDNKGDWRKNPWNTEAVSLDPGASKTIRVIFGFSDGHKAGYKLNPAEVSQLLFFTGKASKECSFQVVSLIAGGKPGEGPPADPEKTRVKPKDGVLLGTGVTFRTETSGGARAETETGKLLVAFSEKGQTATIRPEQGRWDLREAHQVRIKIRNAGTGAVAPAARVESVAGPTERVAPPKPLKAGESGEIVVSFIPAVPWTGDANAHAAKEKPAPGKGTRFISDAVSGVTIFGDERGGEQNLVVESIIAAAPSGTMPDWLGKRPPVEGEWVQTFREEFEGKEIDLSKWNIYTANYWDKLSHFSKDNVIVKNGVAILRYEKKTGRHNDDPKGAETPYASGFLDTYGKWVQRYGYFEARMKLPKAPGLWPAMWLMPDRGLAKGEQWKRASTGEGGMEFDIMEYLSRWGDHRFNIAFHWDGYGEEHRQTGTTCIYTDHDRDGFITSGLLWLPGKAAIYCNGREVARWESPRVSTVPSDIMFTHVMGGWDNNDLDDARLPDDFVIDYVRCWQRRDLASAIDGVKSTQRTPAAPVK